MRRAPLTGATEQIVGAGAWSTLKLGAGGLTSAIRIASDGTKVVRTDTYGAYLYNAAATNPGNAGGTGVWQQLASTNSLSASDANYAFGCGGQCGAYEIVIAASNTSHFYMHLNGWVYSSTNQGSTWTRTAFVNDAGFGPAGARQPTRVYLGRTWPSIRKMRISFMPARLPMVCSNPSTAERAGPKFSGTPTIATASTPSSDCQGGGYLIAFDPTSAVTGGVTQGIYVSSYGTGVYHSTNGGSTWTLTTGTPNSHYNMMVNYDGSVWLLTNTGAVGNTWRLASGTWTNLGASNGQYFTSIAADPSNNGHVYLGDTMGNLAYTANDGTTWVNQINYTSQVATDVPWLVDRSFASTNNTNTFMDGTGIAFDPNAPTKLWMSSGEAVWQVTSPPTTNAAYTWTSFSAGLEQLVTNQIISCSRQRCEYFCFR